MGLDTHLAKFMGPTWGPPGSCRPQMGPMLALWTLLSGYVIIYTEIYGMQIDASTTMQCTWTVLIRGGLTHWGQVTHICIGNLTTTGSDNGLSPGRCHAIIWTNAGILLIGPLGTNFSEFLIKVHTFSFKKMHLKMSAAKWRPFCLCLKVSMPSQIKQRYVITYPWSSFK